MTPYGLPLEPAQPPRGLQLDQERLKALLGKKEAFSDLVAFFDGEEHRLGMEGMLQAYTPLVMAGCVGALTHAVIHLGWGIDVHNRYMTIEGLDCRYAFMLDFLNVRCVHASCTRA